MIESVPSSVIANAPVRNAGIAGDRNDDGFGFVELLDSLSCGVRQPSCTHSVLQSAIAPIASSLVTELGSIAGNGEMGQVQGDSSNVPSEANKVGKEDGTSAALEMILALITATASRIPPWQLKGLDDGSSSENDSKCMAAMKRANANNLSGELPVVIPEKRALFGQTAPAEPALHLNEDYSTEGLESSFDAEESERIDLLVDDAISKEMINRGEGIDHRFRGLVERSNAPAAVIEMVTEGGVRPWRDHKNQPPLGGITGEPREARLAYPQNLAQAERSLNGAKSSPIKQTHSETESDTALMQFGPREAQESVDPTAHQSTQELDPMGSLNNSVVEQIARKAQLLKGRGRSAITFHLEPKELGKVHVHVSASSDGLQVRLAAESADVKQIIQSSLSQLKTAFENQGLTVDRFEVMVGSGSTQLNSQDPGQRQSVMSPSPKEQFWHGDIADNEALDVLDTMVPNSLVDYRI